MKARLFLPSGNFLSPFIFFVEYKACTSSPRRAEEERTHPCPCPVHGNINIFSCIIRILITISIVFISVYVYVERRKTNIVRQPAAAVFADANFIINKKNQTSKMLCGCRIQCCCCAIARTWLQFSTICI